ncbi:hypothetical protein [Myxococcus stipitatus]|uniref:hypothetical protein n=1 Tax=Myxococcus stipitatus TaxID=83455 RepID=UPI0030D57953
MNGWMTSARRWLRRPRTRGQALTELSLLMAALILATMGIATFAPDMFAAYTIYVRGFYVVLGYPLG